MGQDTPKIDQRILFVCVGNTCRIVLAEYLTPVVLGEGVRVESAGIRPGIVDDAETAVYTLKANFGIDASQHRPRDVRSLDLGAYDLVIALDRSAAPVCRTAGLPEAKLRLWNIKDPWGGDLTEYDRAAIEIKRRLFQLKDAWTRTDSTSDNQTPS